MRSSSAAGIKWLTVSGKNPSRNLPRVPTAIPVCDSETGLLDGVSDGTQLIAERTAAMAVAQRLRSGQPAPLQIRAGVRT
ncbi:hypothetical protein [Mesorhizobium sp. M0578]|uniref:hypothetical protein n=1 Tax=Mesorhizobium sp. M0578 TaxID=2956961 RepID=UPI003336C918